MNENFNPSGFINYNRGRTVFARELRKNQTPTEQKLRERLRKDRLGYRFLRQKPLGPYIADFYCAQMRLCIEIDGSIHHRRQEYDQVRTVYLNDHHVSVVRFTNTQIDTDIDGVIQSLQSLLDAMVG